MAEEATGGVDRRRVLIGAAWATPAIVLATSIPARAASGDPGLIALTDVGANLTTGFLTASASVGYASNPANAPVNPVLVSIVVPASIVANDTPTVGTGFWTFVGTTTEGSNKVFTFSYVPGAISGSNMITQHLQASIARSNSDFNPVSVTVRGNGTSLGSPVPQVTQTVATSIGAQIIFNVSPPMQAQTNYQGLGPAYVYYGQTRWNGPYWPVGANVHSVSVVARVPVENSLDQLVMGAMGAGWTQAGPLAVVNGFRRVQFDFAGTLGSSSATTTDLQFGIKASTASPTLGVGVLRAEATSASDGSQVFVQYQGPTVLDGPILVFQDSDFPTPGVGP